jgi:LuxR family transcriptional regulator, maltose regulon positive regulatory protein
MPIPLLVTKLFIPSSRPDLVSRPHLIERLNSGLHRKLTLISAPAGFGKTTLAIEWIHSLGNIPQPSAVAWLSLDEGDNELARFLSYVIAALRHIDEIDNEIGQGALSLLQYPQPPPIETILTLLINEIAAIRRKVILVFDDYHLIDTQSIHGALNFLLKNLPTNFHIIVATRVDPPLSLARLRARDHVTELRAADLRFTSAEAAEFLNQGMGLDLSVEDIAALETRTEGWVAGLQLAALALQGLALRETGTTQGHTNPSGLIQSFRGSDRLVLDYLIEEVLNQQTESIQAFLLQTSILNRLKGSLCDAVRFGLAETPDISDQTTQSAQSILETLERANLFIIPLDDEQNWYRYHHLFAELLRQRLHQTTPEQISTLHSRASRWYDQHGMPSEAIRHALAAENFERTADIAERAWPDWSVSFQSIEWLNWLKRLPDEVARPRPVLCVAFAWANLNAGNLETARVWLENAEHLLGATTEIRSDEIIVVDEDQYQELPISFAAARAYHAQATGNVTGTVKYSQQVLDLLPDGYHPERGTATALLGLAYWTSGDLHAAHQTFSDGLAEMKPLDVIIGTFVLADIKMTLGQLHEAIHTCEFALEIAANHGEPMPLGTEDVYSGISELHREQGNFKAAAQDLAICKQLGEQIELPDWQYRWCVAQARLKQSQGELEEALDLLDQADRFYVRTPLPDVRPTAAMKARIWIDQGAFPRALGWVRERGLAVDDALNFLQEFEHITLARVLIAQFKDKPLPGTLQEAMNLLERLLKAAEDGGRLRSTIEILVLLAHANQLNGDIPRAQAHLERALALANPQGFFQIFVDEGPPLARLLYGIASPDEVPSGEFSIEYVQQLLAAFPIEEPKPKAQKSEWVEPLSEREIEVLQLIAEGLTNQDIATQLYITLNTVKGHARNIYAKLGVKNRTQAIARGKALGILASP